MMCSECKAEFALETVEMEFDKINEFGRREIVFSASGKSWIEWKDGKFSCSKCGNSFTYQEGIMQR